MCLWGVGRVHAMGKVICIASLQGPEAQWCLCRKWFALLVAGIYTIIGIMAAIGAVRSIVNNAVTYHLFANL